MGEHNLNYQLFYTLNQYKQKCQFTQNEVWHRQSQEPRTLNSQFLISEQNL